MASHDEGWDVFRAELRLWMERRRMTSRVLADRLNALEDSSPPATDDGMKQPPYDEHVVKRWRHSTAPPLGAVRHIAAILEMSDDPTGEAGPRRLVRSPEALGSGRWVPSHGVIVLVVIAALLALGIFGVRIMLSSTGDTTRHAPGPSRVAVTGRAPAASSLSSVSSTSPTAGAKKNVDHWSIHVVGAVRRPGVVRVAVDARVADAVAAAGGLSDNADAGGVNLARPLVDGEQIHVPRPGEKWTPPSDSVPGGASGPSAAGGGSAPAAAGNDSTGAGGAVNLNSAGLEQLDSLPGVGPVMAQRILDWRKEHGKFSSVDELGEVSGIGEKTLARLKPKVTV